MDKNRKYWGNSRAMSTLLIVVWMLVALLLLLFLVRTYLVCNHRAHIVEKTGYLPDNDNWDDIPVVPPPYDEKDTTGLYDKVMLEQFFPPIGNQEDKGTCVAWAVGYNLKTALNAIDNHWTPDMLANPAYQTSPKDLFFGIPRERKGARCNGTGFEAAFNVLMVSGAASMKTVPYENLQGCTGTGRGDTNNRVSDFGRVAYQGHVPTVNQLKAYLADTIPLVFGAHLGDHFMKWHSDDVIKYDTYHYNGMHANHAMVLVGYDDSRHAFRVRNSWGTSWGDKGSIWVDYDFFCREFCFVVLKAENRNNK